MGENTIPIILTQYGEAKSPVCINLHDNEYTAVLAARIVLEQTGGLLIKFNNNRQRLVRFRLRGRQYAFDPNGIFSRAGIEKTLKENGSSSAAAIIEIEKFATRILELIPAENTCLVALHNNNPAGYSVNSYLAGGEKAADAKLVYKNEKEDPDDIFLTTDSTIYSKMAAKSFNSIWQDNVKAKKDGSLSVYFGEIAKCYVNVETRHNKTEQYVAMLRALIPVITSSKD